MPSQARQGAAVAPGNKIFSPLLGKLGILRAVVARTNWEGGWAAGTRTATMGKVYKL
jgi:hypothetical protein